VSEGFKMGAAFVDVTTEDNTKAGRESIGSSMMKWAGGLAIGAVISKGITDNLDIGKSTAKLGAQLNLTKEVSQNAGKIAGEVYRDNFGESIPEVNSAIASVGTNLLNLNTASKASIKGVTEQALGLASVFDQDVNEVIRAAGSLIKNGLAKDTTDAMNLMTRAFQSGGNIAGDLLETITEYSPQFAKLGFDGATALGVLSAGLKAGARDGDVMADVFKEFGLRAIDTAQMTSQGYEWIGLNADIMRQKVAAGGKSASDAMVEVLTALQNMKDPVQQNAAGVALFGTQWEDTLRSILPKMDLTETSLTDVTGAVDKMNAASADSAAGGIESVKRQMEGWVQSMTNAEGPLGDITSWALGAGGTLMPVVGNLGMLIVAMNSLSWASVGAGIKVVGSWVAMGIASVANAVIMAASWVAAFWPIVLIVAAVGALVALVIMNWDTIKNVTTSVWNAVWKFVSDIVTKIKDWIAQKVQQIVDTWNWLAALPGKIAGWFTRAKDSAVAKLVELVNWVKGLPGRLLGALGDLGGLLVNAGKRIIEGLWNGLKSAFEKVKNFVSGIGSWIADHKGPIEVDAVLLTPHGKSIMDGLGVGLDKGFEAEVKPRVMGVAGAIADAMPDLSSRPPAFGGDGASLAGTAQQGGTTIMIDNLTVTFPGSLNAMSKTDLRTTAEFLRDQIRNVERSTA
jgi:minor tail protein